MSLLKKIGAGAAASVIAFSFTSCSDTTWVYKTDKTSVASGVYISMLADAYLSALSQVSSNTSTEINNDNIWGQKIGDVKVEEYIKNQAKETAYKYLAVSDKFKEFNLSLDDSDLSNVDSSADSMWNYYSNYINLEKSGVSKNSFKESYKSSIMQQKIFDYYYGKGGIEEVKDKELKKYYYKNYAAAKLLSIPLTNSEGESLSDPEVKTLVKKAKKYQTRLNNGESIDKIIEEYNKENSSDSDTSSSSDDNVSILRKGSTSDKLFKKVSKGKEGDIFYLKESSYIYVGRVEDIKKYEDKYKSYRDSVLSDYKNDDFNKLVEDWADKVKVTVNNAAVKRYKPQNLKVKD